MPDNTQKLDTILNIVADIPEMRKDIAQMDKKLAVVITKQDAHERRLSAVPTDTEVDLKILSHADKCQSSAPRRPFNWNLLLKIILVLLGLAGAVVGVNVI
jgi:hypothetical protein